MGMSLRFFLVLFLAVLLFILPMLACGGSGDGKAETGVIHSKAKQTAQAAAAAAAAEVDATDAAAAAATNMPKGSVTE